MLRCLICALLLAVAGCATVAKPERAVVASSITKQVSPELECLSDCLGEGDTNGEMCVERCID
jgi:Flp pilus assembly protein TadD